MSGQVMQARGDEVAWVEAAMHVLGAGGVVAFPTETVYGLGADAENPSAVNRIFQLKGRPANHPLIAHVALGTDPGKWGVVSVQAQRLMEAFWPGPLSIVLHATGRLCAGVTGGQDTVALRCPAHPVAQKLLSSFAEMGSGVLAAPSANRFGRISPTRAEHVLHELGDAVDLILDGGPCHVGMESTIVDATGDVLRVLRPGAITIDMITECTGLAVARPGKGAEVPRVSGSMDRHYAPLTPARLIPRNTVGLMRMASLSGRRIVCLALDPGFFRRLVAQNEREIEVRAMPADPEGYARCFYEALRSADSEGFDLILIEQPESTPAWEMVLDRVRRSATA